MLSCRHLVCGSPTADALRGRLVSCGAGPGLAHCKPWPFQRRGAASRAWGAASRGRGACCAQAGMKCQTQRLRRHYAKITQALRRNYAIITQPLRNHFAAITQSLRSHYAIITQSLRSHYTVITQFHYASLRNSLRNSSSGTLVPLIS